MAYFVDKRVISAICLFTMVVGTTASSGCVDVKQRCKAYISSWKESNNIQTKCGHLNNFDKCLWRGKSQCTDNEWTSITRYFQDKGYDLTKNPPRDCCKPLDITKQYCHISTTLVTAKRFTPTKQTCEGIEKDWNCTRPYYLQIRKKCPVDGFSDAMKAGPDNVMMEKLGKCKDNGISVHVKGAGSGDDGNGVNVVTSSPVITTILVMTTATFLHVRI